MADRTPGDVADSGSRISFGIGPQRLPIRSTIVLLLASSFATPLVRLLDPWPAAGVAVLWLGGIALWWFANRPRRASFGAEGTRIRLGLRTLRIPAGRRVRVSADRGPVVLEVGGEEIAGAEMPWSGGDWSAVRMREVARRIAEVTGGQLRDDLEAEAFHALRAERAARASAAVDATLETMRQLYPGVYGGDPMPPVTRTRLDKERYHVEDGAQGRKSTDTSRISVDGIEPVGLDANEVSVLDRAWPVTEVDRAFVVVETGQVLVLTLLVGGQRVPLMKRKHAGLAAQQMRWIAARIEEVAERARLRRGGEVPDALKGLVRQLE